MSDLISDGHLDASGSGDSVPLKKFQQLLGQRKADQEKLRDVEGKLASYLDKEREFEEKQLEEQGKWQEALELKNKKLQEFEIKLKSEQDRAKTAESVLIDSAKLNAVLEVLPGKVTKREYLNFIKTDNVLLDTETGDFDAGSIQEVANMFMKEHPSLLEIRTNGKLPGDAASGTSALTHDAWLALPLADKKKRMSEVKLK